MSRELLTELEIENALDVCRRATPGPWKVWSRPVQQIISTVVENEEREMVFSLESNELVEENAVFVALARNLLPRVLHELRLWRNMTRLAGMTEKKDKLVAVSTTDPRVWDGHESTTAGADWAEFPAKNDEE